MSKKSKDSFEPIPNERALVKREAPLPVPTQVESGNEPPKKKRKRRRLWPVVLAIFSLSVIAGVFILQVPKWQTLDPLKLSKLAQTSRLYDQNGSLVTVLRGRENRTIVPLSKVPKDVQNAFIAAEDLRFYQHNGFDVIRLAGAVAADIRTQSLAEGASTISQQLIKLTHLSDIKTFARKAEELFLSIQLDWRYSKEEILEMYLNTIYFGEGAYGIQSASEYFFGKDVSELTALEGASLAAALKAPSAYGPTTSPERNKTRRNYILQTMVENDLLDSATAEQAKTEELVLVRQNPPMNVHGWYVDAALEEAEKLLSISPDELLAGGYFIETALDTGLQASAESLFANGKNFPANASDGTPVQGAMAVVNTKTGGVAAIVGGREYAVRRGFNRATHMRRQPGSALKPLAVYAPALEKGYTTASILSDERADFGGGYNPRNAGNVYHGNVTLRRALALSMNVATVRLMKEIGVGTSMEFLQRAGIPLTDTDANLSLALGAMTLGVTPVELAGSYAMFGNDGQYTAPHFVTGIYAPDGSTLYAQEPAPKRVLSSQNNYLMTSLMQSVTGWGTGAKLSATGLSVAGKTGTVSLVGTSGNRDIWMAAYTSDYAVSCWMGFDNTDKNHYLPSRQSGGDATAAMATAFLKSAYKDRAKPSFKAPSGLVWLTIDTAASTSSGSPMLAGNYTPDSYRLSEVFLESNRPWATSNIWQSPRALSYFYIDTESSGHPKLVFGATDAANYRIERIRNGDSVVVTELYGSAGQSLSYTDWGAVSGEWYTYRVTPIHTGMLDSGVLLEGPASTQSIQAKMASAGGWDSVMQFLGSGGNP